MVSSKVETEDDDDSTATLSITDNIWMENIHKYYWNLADVELELSSVKNWCIYQCLMVCTQFC